MRLLCSLFVICSATVAFVRERDASRPVTLVLNKPSDKDVAVSDLFLMHDLRHKIS